MLRNLKLLLAAVGALLVLAPAAAHAEILLVGELGEEIHPGDEITGTSITFYVSPSGTTSCAKIILHLEVRTNGPDHVELKPLGEATSEACTLAIPPISLPATMTKGIVGELTLDTWGQGSTSVTYVFDVPAAGITCHFSGTVAFAAIGGGSDKLNVGPSSLAVTGPGCPQSATTSGTLTLETATGKPVLVGFVETS